MPKCECTDYETSCLHDQLNSIELSLDDLLEYQKDIAEALNKIVRSLDSVGNSIDRVADNKEL